MNRSKKWVGALLVGAAMVWSLEGAHAGSYGRLGGKIGEAEDFIREAHQRINDAFGPVLEQVKEPIKASIEKNLKTNKDHEALRSLLDTIEQKLLADKFTLQGTVPGLTLKFFSIQENRWDLTFSYTKTYVRSCPAIFNCASETMTVEVKGLTAIDPKTPRVLYTIPQSIGTSFYREFLKGGSASVGGRR